MRIAITDINHAGIIILSTLHESGSYMNNLIEVSIYLLFLGKYVILGLLSVYSDTNVAREPGNSIVCQFLKSISHDCAYFRRTFPFGVGQTRANLKLFS